MSVTVLSGTYNMQVTDALGNTVDQHILMQDSATGQVLDEDVQTGTINLFGAAPGAAWTAIDTGDFNNDHHVDTVLQKTNGDVAVWESDGADHITSSAIIASPGVGWKVIGTGDFDGDHKSDILLQNVNGDVAVWEMDGTTIKSSAVIASPGASWKAIDTVDNNHDGKSDIVLQSTSGQVAIWDMNGTSISSSALIGPSPGADWHLVDATGGDGAHQNRLWFQNDVSHSQAEWDVNGSAITGSASLGGSSYELIAGVGAGGGSSLSALGSGFSHPAGEQFVGIAGGGSAQINNPLLNAGVHAVGTFAP